MAEKDKNEDEYKENLENSSMQDDEDFGLPDLDEDDSTEDIVNDSSENSEEEEMILPTEEEISDQTITFDSEEEDNSYYQEENKEEELFEEEEEEGPVAAYVPPKQSSAPLIIGLLIIVLAACVAVYFFFIRDVEPKEPVSQEPVKDTTSYVVEKPVEVEEVIEEPIEVKEEAVINTLNTRSGRSYVVVGSFFDDDLAMDYAKQLKKAGTSTYIIPPFGKSKFTRVAVEETTTFADASSKANELAGQFKEQPWPLKF